MGFRSLSNWLLIVAVCLSCWAATSLAEPLTLVQDGHPQASILIDGGVSVSERFAVQELRRFVQAMTGTPLPVLWTGDAAANDDRTTLIVLGRKTVEKREPKLKLDGLGSDGFIIRRQGNHLIIAGGELRGTLYGVYTLLEQLGCRWWTPTESTIPRMNTLVVGDIDLREVPKIEYRDMMYADLWGPPSTVLWRVRNKINGFTGGTIPEQYGGQVQFEGSIIHSYGRLLERNKALNYAGSQNLWALHEGKRNRQQPCTTDPAIIRAMTQSVRQRIREHPEDAFVVVGQNDGGVYCQCDRCKALTEREGSPSALVVSLANEVARDIAAEAPKARIMASAYDWSRRPPAHLKPVDNVMIALSSSGCDFGHPLATSQNDANIKFREDLEGWSRIARNLYVWDYTTSFGEFLMPFPDLDALVPNIRFYAEHHVTGYFAQGSHLCRAAEFAPLRMWVLAKAMWNPDVDSKALISEFLKGYYGPAAGAIQRYIDTIEGPVRADPQLTVPSSWRTQIGDQPWLAPGVVAEAESCLREAEDKVKGNRVLERRVRHAHMPIWYVLARRGPGSGSWRAVEAKLGPLSMSDVARSLLTVLKDEKVNALSEKGRGRRLKVWSEWLADCAARAGRTGEGIPEELKGVDPASYRLVHAMQTSFPVGWGEKEPQASDGWVVKVQSDAWLTQYRLIAGEDFVPGTRYTAWARVRVPKVNREGVAFTCGLYSKGRTTSRAVRTGALEAGKFQVLRIGAVIPVPGQLFWIAASKGGEIPSVDLDCFWLRVDEGR